MAPTATGYLHGLRRLWWVPMIAVFVGVGIGLWASGRAQPSTTTTGYALFTFRIDDPGDESAGSARGAEAEVAQARLASYVNIARSSQGVRDILMTAGIEQPATDLAPDGSFKDGNARALIAGTDAAPGLVEIEVKNKDLSQAQADRLVDELSREVARQTIDADSRQETPSLSPDSLILEPQPTEPPESRAMMLTLPVISLLSVGLGVVYLVEWRKGLVYSRGDIEERIGARVLGEFSGRPADSPAIALALRKGREPGAKALLVPARNVNSGNLASVGSSVAEGGGEVGLQVRLETVGGSRPPGVSEVTTGTNNTIQRGESSSDDLTLIDSPAGLTADSLRSAASVDIVGLIVEYGVTSYREIEAAGQTLAEITDAEIAVIGVHQGINSPR